MKKVKVAILDSGINQIFDNKINCISLLGDKDTNDYLGHGTGVSHIIISNCNAEVIMIKITNLEENLYSKDLILGLEYIYENLDVDIINLSLGTIHSELKEELKDICDKIISKGIIIVSSFSNDGSISYPAGFKNVIGVDVNKNIYNIKEYEYIEGGIINIRGANIKQYLPYNKDKIQYVMGTSFIAPYITAKISNYIENGITKLEDIKENLKSDAKRIIYNTDYEVINNSFEIKKAVLFPFNKEIRNILKFNNLTKFEINGVFDFKFMKTINKTCDNSTKSYVKSDLKILSFDNINWEDSFDTFILGHVKEVSILNKKDYIELILKKCINHNKNIFAFDDLSNYNDLLNLMLEKNLKFYYPTIKNNNIPNNLFGKLYNINVPVIGIFGTSSKQGKFNLQLRLRELFLKDGYNIGQIGTEPNSLLFGMDFVYHNGYHSNIYIDTSDEIKLLNYMIYELEENNKEIIIVGGQSNITYYGGNNLCYMPTSQHSFLLGTRPDVVILCVNVYDDIEYINRSIKYIEGTINSKVIGIVISPIKEGNTDSTLVRKIELLNKEEINNFKNKLKSIFNNIVLINLLSENEVLILYDTIIEYFLE